MTDRLFRLIVDTHKGQRIVLAGEGCHDTKSLAGTIFHYAENVRSVCVAGQSGSVYLYLVKDAPEKIENVPSPAAEVLEKTMAKFRSLRV